MTSGRRPATSCCLAIWLWRPSPRPRRRRLTTQQEAAVSVAAAIRPSDRRASTWFPRTCDADADRLLRRFLEAVYRRPADAQDMERFGRVIRAALAADFSFADAMIAGYTAVLSSPALLYFDERPGPLSDRALAERLAYFLWNTRPDDQLLRRAERGELHQPEVLREETERMLADPRSRQFVDAFLDFWLDLRMIVATSPDTSLYPDYDLDDLLTESMVEETQTFIAEIIRENLSVVNLIDCDFAMLNERLATHYGIPGVEGVPIRRVKLPEGSVRGGLLTQGSVLKVTANGTTTSPVVRGAWVMDRLLGQPPPPPPEAVPAVDPDVRGATTIRLQLEKHRQIESCNACHKHIDPAGLALENFDVMGVWRTNYRSLGAGEPVSGVGHNGLRFRFKPGPEVDPSGELADGRRFRECQRPQAVPSAGFSPGGAKPGGAACGLCHRSADRILRPADDRANARAAGTGGFPRAGPDS